MCSMPISVRETAHMHEENSTTSISTDETSTDMELQQIWNFNSYGTSTVMELQQIWNFNRYGTSTDMELQQIWNFNRQIWNLFQLLKLASELLLCDGQRLELPARLLQCNFNLSSPLHFFSTQPLKFCHLYTHIRTRSYTCVSQTVV